MPDFPNTSPADLPSSIATAVTQQLKQADDAHDIVDPSVARPDDAPPSFRPTEAPKPTVTGAVPDAGYTPEILRQAAAIGLNETAAKKVPPELIQVIAAQQQRQPSPQFSPPVEAGPTPEEIQHYASQGYFWNGYGYQPFQQRQQQGPQHPDLRNWSGQDAAGNPTALPDVIAESFESRDRHGDALIARIDRRLDELEQRERRTAAEMDRRESVRLTGLLNDSIENDKVYAPVYQTDPQAAGKLGDAMNAMKQINPQLSHKQLYELARNTLFGVRQAEAAVEQQIGERLRNAQGQFIGKPSQSGTSANNDIDQMPYGPERAVARQERIAKFGFNGQ